MRYIVSIVVALSAALPCHAQNLLDNADFEGAFAESGMADGWLDNSSWAELDVAYSRETTNPHSGKACLRVDCTRLDSGAVQVIPARPVPLRKGKLHHVKAWVRGDVGAVAIQFRLAPAPYTIYAEQAVVPGPDWRMAEYFWTSTVDDRQGRFMLRITRKGTLWVDDLSIKEVTIEEARRLVSPPVPGNLLHNGNFDLGVSNWLMSHGVDYTREAKMSIAQGEDGPCLRVDLPENLSTVLSSDAVELAQGHPVMLSFRIKGSGSCSAQIRHCAYRKLDVKDEWQTVTLRGNARFGVAMNSCMSMPIRGPATIYIDDVRLWQASHSQGAAGLRMSIISDRHPMSLYHRGETPVLRLYSSIPSGKNVGRVEWQVEDFWGNVVNNGQWTPAAGRNTRDIRCGGLALGWYRGRVTWSADGRDMLNECTFCLLPPAERSGDIETSPFGAHFAVAPTSLRLAKSLGVRRLRLHPPNHTKWRTVERDQGEWRWRDEAIQAALSAGLKLCGSLDRCPDWASSAPPGTKKGGFYTGIGAWLPRDWAEWENYVALTVRRYKNDIHTWEVWNEPNLTNWLIPREGQTRAQAYVEMLQHTTPILRREDPSATVIGGCIAGALTRKSGAWKFYSDIVDLGALDLMDVLSFHEYISSSVDERSEPLEEWIGRVREKMRAAGKVVPIINSEGGYAVPGTSITYRPRGSATVPPDRMARWLVRQYVAQMALDVKRFYFYNFFIDGSPFTNRWEGMLEGDGQPLPNVAAYAAMTWLLDGAAFDRTERPSENLWAHHFTSPRGPMVVAWSRSDTTAALPLPRAVAAWDLMGAAAAVPEDRVFKVTDAPIYVRLEVRAR